MNDPLLMWSDQLAAAQTDDDRRALLTKLATWRAQNLTNIPATRRATYTVARLFHFMGLRDKAVSEAQNLMSLCRTPPEAADEEIASVQSLMEILGMASQPAPRVSGADRPRERKRGREREPRAERETGRERRETKGGSPGQIARAAAQVGDWASVIKATDGVRGAAPTVMRAYAMLSALLEGPEAERGPKLDALRDLLGRSAGMRSGSGGGGVADGTLAALLGEPVPTRRGARMRVIDDFAAANPERIDDLAEAALLHHVSTSGPGTPAPWLVGIVGGALATGTAEKTQATIAKLRAEKAVAVTAYDEWPFERLQRLTRRAAELGHGVGRLRRGVLPKEEPDDRKLWTLRVIIEGVERMIVVGPHATRDYAKGKAEVLAARLLALCPRTLLLATGSGNEDLRQHSGALGLSVEAHDADDEALLTTLAAAGASVKPAAAPPPERLVAALEAEDFDAEAVRAAVADFRRPDRALRPVLRMELDDTRTAALLEAVHAATDPSTVIPEGATLGIRTATHGPMTRAAITQGPAASRFGGPGVDAVIDITGALVGDGWELHRVLRGPTRRESRLHPAVETLGGHMGGLWRLLVRRADQRGEVWYIAELPAEGQAAVPLLLLEDHHRMVVLPPDEALTTWWGTLAGAPTPIPWTGAEGDAVKAAAAAFPAVPPPGDASPDNGAKAASPEGGPPAPEAAEPTPEAADDQAQAADAVAPPEGSAPPEASPG